MLKMIKKVTYLFISLYFTSCNGQIKADETCINKFKVARELAYVNSIRISALDSAMTLANECLNCDSIRKAVIDFKIMLYVMMKKYGEGIIFIDSLNDNDFMFSYKRKFISMELQALEFKSKKDTIRETLIYKDIVDDIEHYLETKRNIDGKEFMEVFSDLFTIKEKFLDAAQINRDVEALKNKYPNKRAFFDFFKKE